MQGTYLKEDEHQPIEFHQVLAILNIIPLGIFLSSICLIIEISMRKRQNEIRVNNTLQNVME